MNHLQPDLTLLLQDLGNGNTAALPEITPIVMAELQRLAKREMRKERSDHTLQTMALINEAYVKLVSAELPWENRGHFYAIAARQMRRILVDHARKKSADRRGGSAEKISIDDTMVVSDSNILDILYMDQLFDQLEAFDSRSAKLFELRLFSGLSNEEIAEMENLSVATVERDLRAAKAWMKNELMEHYEHWSVEEN